MNRFSPRERKTFYAFAVCACLVLLDQGVVTPWTGYWQSLDDAVARKRAEVVRKEHLLADAERIRSQFAALHVSRSAESSSLFNEVEKVARASGLRINDEAAGGQHFDGY
jgi:type II secretory pathway component PulM